MTIADIATGMRLKDQAGWNQLEADWRRLIDLQPDGCFLAEHEGEPVGTVTTCKFGAVAWIAMMLVDERFRGRGFGRALMVHALNELDAQGIRSIRLDATPLGQPLYSSLGFVAEALFTRYQGIFTPISAEEPEPGVVESSAFVEATAALDQDVTGTDRGRLLRRLAEEHPGALQVVAEGTTVSGFLMSRPGSRARQIGPCLANMQSGSLLFQDARRRYPGEPVFIDIPDENEPAAVLATALGLSAGRHLTRMGRGPRVAERRDRLWASAGPEKG
jgi:GNAT superfamily N-acetyltransferase